MKKKIILALVATALLASWTALAQNSEVRKDWQDRIKSEKIAFLTSFIDLTPEEAQVFWPVYNKAEKETAESFKELISSFKALNEATKNGKSDSEIKVLLSDYLNAKEKNEAVARSYADEYLKVLPASKVAKLFIGEEQFRRNQIHRLRAVPNQGKTSPRFGKGGTKPVKPPKADEPTNTAN